MHNDNLDAYSGSYKNDFYYFEDNAIILKQYVNYMVNEITLNNYKSALSLGVGHSMVTNALMNAVRNDLLDKYEIIEGSPEVIEQFRSSQNTFMPSSVSMVNGYFENYETEAKFDIIEMGFVLEHVDDPGYVLKRFKSFLNPNGKIFIAVPNAESLHRRIGFAAGMMESIVTLSKYDLELGHQRYFTLSSLLDLVKEADLKVENVSGLMLKPITTAQMSQLKFSDEIVEGMNKVAEEYPALANAIYIRASLNK